MSSKEICKICYKNKNLSMCSSCGILSCSFCYTIHKHEICRLKQEDAWKTHIKCKIHHNECIQMCTSCSTALCHEQCIGNHECNEDIILTLADATERIKTDIPGYVKKLEDRCSQAKSYMDGYPVKYQKLCSLRQEVTHYDGNNVKMAKIERILKYHDDRYKDMTAFVIFIQEAIRHIHRIKDLNESCDFLPFWIGIIKEYQYYEDKLYNEEVEEIYEDKDEENDFSDLFEMLIKDVPEMKEKDNNFNKDISQITDRISTVLTIQDKRTMRSQSLDFSLKWENDRLKEDVKNMKAIIKGLQVKIRKCYKEKEQQQNTEVDSLRLKFKERIQQERDMHFKLVDEYKSQLSTLEQELECQKGKVESLQREFEQVKDEERLIREERDHLSLKFTHCKKDYVEISEKYHKCCNRISEIEKSNECQSKVLLHERDREILELKITVSQFETMVEDLNRELEKCKDSESQYYRLIQKLELAENSEKTIREERDKLRLKFSHCKKDYIDVYGKFQKCETSSEMEKSKITLMENLLEEREKEIQELKVKIQHFEGTSDPINIDKRVHDIPSDNGSYTNSSTSLII